MKHQIRQGIPARFRPRVWQALLKNKLTIKIGQYQKLSSVKPNDDVVKQIALDLPRTSRNEFLNLWNSFKLFKIFQI